MSLFAIADLHLSLGEDKPMDIFAGWNDYTQRLENNWKSIVTDNEAALIGGLISNYFFQPSVDAKLRESYRRVLRHLRENTLSASDLSRIQNALTFLSPLCRDTREAHKDMMGVTLKTDALLRANR